MNWLVMRVFGNGHGMGAPYFDKRAYWLVDVKEGRDAGRGRWYSWIGGAGAQLESYEWRAPKPGERRKLAGMEFRPFLVSRGYFPIRVFGMQFRVIPMMWKVSWALARPSNLEGIRALEGRLGRWDTDYGEAA